MPADVTGEQRSGHRGDLQQNETSDKTKNQQTGHEVDQMGSAISVHRSARQIRNEQMADNAHRCRRYNLVKLETDKCLEPSPEEEFGFIEDHPWDEHGADQANDCCSDRAVGNDYADQCGKDAEDDLHCVGAEQRIRLRERGGQRSNLAQSSMDCVLHLLG